MPLFTRGSSYSIKHKYDREQLFFFHPDFTVGFGITPNLRLLAGSSAYAALPPVRDFTLPRRQQY